MTDRNTQEFIIKKLCKLMQSFEKHRDTRESMDYVEYLIFQILGQKIIEDFGVERYQDYVNEQLEIHLSEVQNAKVH